MSCLQVSWLGVLTQASGHLDLHLDQVYLQASQARGHSLLADTSKSWPCQMSLSLKARQNSPVGFCPPQ